MDELRDRVARKLVDWFHPSKDFDECDEHIQECYLDRAQALLALFHGEPVAWGVEYDGGPIAEVFLTREEAEAACREAVNEYDVILAVMVPLFAAPPPDRIREAMEVVCLCGSTSFADQHAIRRWELESQGAGKVVVLMINYLPSWWAKIQGWDGNDHFGERAGLKAMLDELHLRKIDLADRVEVINPGGYVGESTAREILYAQRTGKPVTYMEEPLTGPGVAILGRSEP